MIEIGSFAFGDPASSTGGDWVCTIVKWRCQSAESSTVSWSTASLGSIEEYQKGNGDDDESVFGTRRLKIQSMADGMKLCRIASRFSLVGRRN